MKNALIVISLVLISLTACSKEKRDGFQLFYKQYHDQTGVISFKLPASLANIFVDNEDEEAKEFLKKADNVTFLIADPRSSGMIDTMNLLMPVKKWPVLMEIKDGSSTVRFMVYQQENYIRQILMTVQDGNELVIMAIKGKFTIDDAKKIAKSIDVNKASKKE